MSFADHPRWNLWRYLPPLPNGKRPKKPYDLDQLPGISTERIMRLGTRAEVTAQWDRNPNAFEGRGYAPHIDDPYACLDFDNLTLPGPLEIWAVFSLISYCERSPSNLPHQGHAIVTLNRAAKERLKGIRNLMPGLELYSDSGFFTVTDLAINDLPIIDASNHVCSIADHYNLHPANTQTVPTSITGREVTRKEIGRVYEKIEQWHTGQQFIDMRDNWTAVSRWAQVGDHGGPDRSFLMLHFVSMLVNAGVRDPDLLWAIIEPSAVWCEYKAKWPKPGYAEKQLWRDIVAKKLANTPEPPKSDGIIKLPTFMKDGGK